jgi:hypothetical protein
MTSHDPRFSAWPFRSRARGGLDHVSRDPSDDAGHVASVIDDIVLAVVCSRRQRHGVDLPVVRRQLAA